MAGQLPFAITVGGVSFLLAVIWGGPFVEVLRRLKIGKLIRIELGEVQQRKVGTPTMGGIMIVVPVVLIALGLNLVNVIRTVTGASIMLPLIVMVGFGALGMLDDWEGIQRSQGRPVGEGISPRAKFTGQLILATGVALMISFYGGGFQVANRAGAGPQASASRLSQMQGSAQSLFQYRGTSRLTMPVRLTKGLTVRSHRIATNNPSNESARTS